MEPKHLRRRALRTAAAALAVLVASELPASGEQDPTEQQRRVRQERANAAAQIDALRADQRTLESSLDALDVHLSEQRTIAGEALEEQRRAEADAAEAAAAERAKAAEIAQLEQDARRVALEAYIGQRPNRLWVLFGADDPMQQVTASVLFDVVVRNNADVVDELDAARQDLAAARQEAEATAAAAGSSKARAEREVIQLQEAIELQQRLADNVDGRLDAALAEADALTWLDAKLSEQIKAQEIALAARLAESRRQAELAARRAGPASGSRGGGSSGGGGRSLNVPQITSSGEMVEVAGILVSSSIANNVAGLVTAAGAAGFDLGGGGYRNPEQQIQVRRNNCGTSEYDIWQRPPSQCNPPAARPGTSMHEQGLAIDFTCNGSLITSRSSACFRWMEANAPRYGLINLPSEPWHWSVNGR